MLELREYTKEELVAILKCSTNKTSNITTNLYRMGYRYETNGKKGKNYRIIITALPQSKDKFKRICVDQLGIPAQSDFYILKHFFYYFFCDDDFRKLNDSQMAEVMAAEDKSVTRQTIGKWKSFLEGKELFYKSATEYTYFVTFADKTILEITKEEYKAAWNKYWEVKRLTGNATAAFSEMRKVNGGSVSSAPKIEENGFYSELIDALVEAIESEEK